MRRGDLIRLYPTGEQDDLFSRSCGCARLVANASLEQALTARWLGGSRQSCTSQDLDLTEIKRMADYEFLRDVHSDVLQQALRDRERAWENFFEHGFGFPRFKRKGQGESFRLMQRPSGKTGQSIEVRRVSRHWVLLKLPKAGWVRGRIGRMPKGRITSVTISRTAWGWQAALALDDERETAQPRPVGDGGEVGVDRGVVVSAATSDGDLFCVPQPGRGELERERRLQKRLARQQKGSRRRERTKRELAKLRGRQRLRRRDALHKISTRLADRYRLVALEDLDVRAMTTSAKGTVEQPGTNVAQKAGLNRAILQQGWGELARMLDYKLSERGGRLVKVPAAYTSQTCHECGHASPDNRESQAEFRCVACEHTEHADINAARNILRAGQVLERDHLALEAAGEEGLVAAGQAVPARGALCAVMQGDEARTTRPVQAAA